MISSTVVSVSMPRSGHHLLVKILRRYFGRERFSYCEYYSPAECCKQVPCTVPGRQLQKNHDHGLALPQRDDVRYLIEYRSFIASTISDYELFVRDRADECDLRETWMLFCLARMDYWRCFLDKWVLKTPPKHSLAVSYETLLADPENTLVGAIAFIFPNEPPERARIRAAIQKVRLLGDRDIREFKYYDPAFFIWVERQLHSHLKELGIPETEHPTGEERKELRRSLGSFRYGSFALEASRPLPLQAVRLNLQTRLTKEIIDVAFRYVLGRTPADRVETRRNFDLRTIENLRRALLRGTEFKLSFGKPVDVQAFPQPLSDVEVRLAYLFLLGRMPSDEELTDSLRNERSPAALRSRLLARPEVQQQVRAQSLQVAGPRPNPVKVMPDA